MTARRKKDTNNRRYPIIFSGHMVDSAFRGTRTQLRKRISFNRGFEQPLPFMWDSRVDAPNGVVSLQRMPGDSSLWWACGRTVSKYAAVNPQYGGPGSLLYVREEWADVGAGSSEHIAYRHGPNKTVDDALTTWRPGIVMKKAHARLWIRIKDTRAERLCDISDVDIGLSGFNSKGEFKTHWDAANYLQASWKTNPWVWVVDFSVDGMTKR